MNKTAFAVCLTLLIAAASYADPEPSFMPMIPDVMAEGGGMVASAHGYDAFFTNPAGFSRSPGELTIASFTGWLYARPDRVLTMAQSGPAGGSSNVLDFINKEVTSGGIGAGGSLGIGWAGSGFGIGAFMVMDSYLYGRTLMGVSGDLTATVALILGYSLPIRLGPVNLHVGADIRPMIRIHAPITNATALGLISAVALNGDIMSALNSTNALHGVGMALDLGAIAELGWFSFGLSVRDVGGTSFAYSQSQFGTIVSTLTNSQKLPEGTPVTGSYAIPMDVGAGLALHPDFGSLRFLVDPTVHVDINDIVGIIQNQRSPWTLLHVGAEVQLLSIFSARAGLDQGYLTAGVGLHLLLLEANIGIFTRELGAHIGDRPSSGATAEVAVRF